MFPSDDTLLHVPELEPIAQILVELDLWGAVDAEVISHAGSQMWAREVWAQTLSGVGLDNRAAEILEEAQQLKDALSDAVAEWGGRQLTPLTAEA